MKLWQVTPLTNKCLYNLWKLPAVCIGQHLTTNLRNCHTKDYNPFLKLSQAGVVLSRLKGCPLCIRVLRWRASDGTVYRPLIKLLRALRTENPMLQLGHVSSQQSSTKDRRSSPSQCLKEGRQVNCQRDQDKNFCRVELRTLTHLFLTGSCTLCSSWEKQTLGW